MKSESEPEAKQIGTKQMIPYKMELWRVGVEDKKFAYIRTFEKIQF